MKNAETHIQRNKRRNFQDECDEPKTNRKAVTKPETFTEPQNAAQNKLFTNRTYRVFK